MNHPYCQDKSCEHKELFLSISAEKKTIFFEKAEGGSHREIQREQTHKKGWGKRYRNLAGLLCTMLLCASAGTADACTAAYVGRDASSDGVPVIARCADTNPPTTSVYLRITPEGRSRTVTGKNGFSWKLPEHTYKFVSVPRSPALEKGHEWDSAAIND